MDFNGKKNKDQGCSLLTVLEQNGRLLTAGVSILRYIGISIPIKYSNFSGFYKKLGPFYKKLRCDKFGN